ncbi:MAG: DUF4265 domain-containing protein [Solirubrobacterales bacterium]
MNDQATYTDAAIRVAAPVTELGLPICSEVMTALPDPADSAQAILVSVPVLADEVNFGDIVRLGEEDECGIRPIFEVVVASGHAHMLAAAEDRGALDLAAELERTFPAYALRMVTASDSLLSVSVHPDLEPGRVGAVIASWLSMDAGDPEDGPALGAVCRSSIGRPLRADASSSR